MEVLMEEQASRSHNPVLGESVDLEPSGTVKIPETTAFSTLFSWHVRTQEQQACYRPGEHDFLYLEMSASVFPRLTL